MIIITDDAYLKIMAGFSAGSNFKIILKRESFVEIMKVFLSFYIFIVKQSLNE